MLELQCPFCGPRNMEEFTCGGQAAIVRPAPSASVDDNTWAQYLYYRDNARGWHYERWRHAHGCGEWFNMLRHSHSQEIRGPFDITLSRKAAES